MSVSKKVEDALSSMEKKELGGIKVLMIEDDAMIQELVVNILVSQGCIPYTTGDGLEAIAMAEQYKPSIIILDLMLPGKSGEEILKELKEKEDLSSIPVIVFSNKSNRDDIKNLLSLGADKYFVKSSTDLKDLVATIKELG